VSRLDARDNGQTENTLLKGLAPTCENHALLVLDGSGPRRQDEKRTILRSALPH
jgi:hypothetical protein